MAFNTVSFVAFFVCFFCIYSFVTRTTNQKLWFSTIASLFFYGCWNYKFVPLLVGTGLVDFYIASAIAKNTDARRRKLLLVLSITMNLGVLATFKYANFFFNNGSWLLGLLGLHVKFPVLDVVLPIGISFYTFQSISYTVDVYRKTFKARKRIREFLAALTFFPHLVAGPIVRSSYILPQFEQCKPPTWDMCKRGFLLVVVGLAKKTIADLLGGTVDPLFEHGVEHNVLDSWTAALAFSGQIYGDFSGYTDMASGLALLLGYTLPPNFELPYLATSPVVFWHRWHISFSTWLRDYLWLPLSVANPTRPLLVLVVTMLLGGLWHGASWLFVLWGLYHGLLLAITHLILRHTKPPTHGPIRWAGIALTFYLVTLGWVLFRATTLADAWNIVRGMHYPHTPTVWAEQSFMTVALVVVAIVSCHAIDYFALRKKDALMRPALLWPTMVLLLAFSMIYQGSGRTFIYFQF